ncbi:unnamed protein product, partial [Ectocarpus sp. 4 AP-2014]
HDINVVPFDQQRRKQRNTYQPVSNHAFRRHLAGEHLMQNKQGRVTFSAKTPHSSVLGKRNNALNNANTMVVATALLCGPHNDREVSCRGGLYKLMSVPHTVTSRPLRHALESGKNHEKPLVSLRRDPNFVENIVAAFQCTRENAVIPRMQGC